MTADHRLLILDHQLWRSEHLAKLARKNGIEDVQIVTTLDAIAEALTDERPTTIFADATLGDADLDGVIAACDTATGPVRLTLLSSPCATTVARCAQRMVHHAIDCRIVPTESDQPDVIECLDSVMRSIPVALPSSDETAAPNVSSSTHTANDLARDRRIRLIIVGAGPTDGPIVRSMLENLSAAINAPMLIAMPTAGPIGEAVATSLAASTKLNVSTAANGAFIRSGNILMTPGDSRLGIRTVMNLPACDVTIDDCETNTLASLIDSVPDYVRRDTLVVVTPSVVAEVRDACTKLCTDDGCVIGVIPTDGVTTETISSGVTEQWFTPEDLGHAIASSTDARRAA